MSHGRSWLALDHYCTLTPHNRHLIDRHQAHGKTGLQWETSWLEEDLTFLSREPLSYTFPSGVTDCTWMHKRPRNSRGIGLIRSSWDTAFLLGHVQAPEVGTSIPSRVEFPYNDMQEAGSMKEYHTGKGMDCRTDLGQSQAPCEAMINPGWTSWLLMMVTHD